MIYVFFYAFYYTSIKDDNILQTNTAKIGIIHMQDLPEQIRDWVSSTTLQITSQRNHQKLHWSQCTYCVQRQKSKGWRDVQRFRALAALTARIQAPMLDDSQLPNSSSGGYNAPF